MKIVIVFCLFMLNVNAIFCLLIVGNVFFCSKELSENEPANNIRKNAIKVDVNRILKGTYYSTSGRDIDYIYVNTDSSKILMGNLQGVKGVDSEILFFRKGESKPFKIVNDNGSSLPERFGPFFVETPGIVIALRPKEPVNRIEYKELDYQFTVNLEAAPDPVETEPNENINEANLINGSHVFGYYNSMYNSRHEMEEDYFVLTLPDEKKYRLSVDLSAVQGVDSVLRFYSLDGETLISVDNGVSGQTEHLSIGLDGPGKAVFSVNAKDGVYSETEPYKLSVDLSEYDDKYEFEPNDVINKATKLSAERIYASFSNATDVDYYSYYNQSNKTQKLSLEVVPAGAIDVQLEFFKSITSNSTLVFNDAKGEAREGIANRIVGPLQTVYVRVSNNSVSSGENLEYTFNWQASAYAESLEREPNNQQSLATFITKGNTITGFVNPKQDVDYYRIKINEQGKYKVQLKSISACKMSLQVADNKGYKTEGKTAGKPGEDIYINAILDFGGYLIVSCIDVKGQNLGVLYDQTYKLSFIDL